MPVLTFKVTDTEERTIRARARMAKAKSLSAFLRKRALGESSVKPQVIRGIHPISGLPYNKATGRIVTEDEIHEALIDFP